MRSTVFQRFLACVHIHISTHDLTRRSTGYQVTGTGSDGFQLSTSRGGRQATAEHQVPQATFQLTTSRRGRLDISVAFHQAYHFNSRPHEEVDIAFFRLFFANRISTHDLTKRSTCVFAQSRWAWYYFNSRPHKEVDQSNSQKHLCY